MEICKLDGEDDIFQLANIGLDSAYQNTPNWHLKTFSSQNACTFLNKRLFLIFFPDYSYLQIKPCTILQLASAYIRLYKKFKDQSEACAICK